MTAPKITEGEGAPLLTSNDLADAEVAAMLAIAWHRDGPSCGFKTREIRKLKALIKKLSRACDHLNPYLGDPDAMPYDWGDDPVYGPLPAPPKAP